MAGQEGGEARMAEKAEARGRNLGPGFCVPGPLGFRLWTLGAKAASCSRWSREWRPQVWKSVWGPLGYL